jgi:hypothetical protein
MMMMMMMMMMMTRTSTNFLISTHNLDKSSNIRAPLGTLEAD